MFSVKIALKLLGTPFQTVFFTLKNPNPIFFVALSQDCILATNHLPPGFHPNLPAVCEKNAI